MLKPEQVPDKVWSAFHEAVLRYGYKPQAIAAALNAWPGMHIHEWQRPWLGGMSGTDLIIPLTEASDE